MNRTQSHKYCRDKLTGMASTVHTDRHQSSHMHKLSETKNKVTRTKAAEQKCNSKRPNTNLNLQAEPYLQVPNLQYRQTGWTEGGGVGAGPAGCANLRDIPTCSVWRISPTTCQLEQHMNKAAGFKIHSPIAHMETNFACWAPRSSHAGLLYAQGKTRHPSQGWQAGEADLQ